MKCCRACKYSAAKDQGRSKVTESTNALSFLTQCCKKLFLIIYFLLFFHIIKTSSFTLLLLCQKVSKCS